MSSPPRGCPAGGAAFGTHCARCISDRIGSTRSGPVGCAGRRRADARGTPGRHGMAGAHALAHTHTQSDAHRHTHEHSHTVTSPGRACVGASEDPCDGRRVVHGAGRQRRGTQQAGLPPPRSAPGPGYPLRHLRRDWGPSRPHVHRSCALSPASAPGLGSRLSIHAPCLGSPRHICAGTGLTPPTLHQDWARLMPHLHRDRAHPAHICAGTASGVGRDGRRADRRVRPARAARRARGDEAGAGAGYFKQGTVVGVPRRGTASRLG
jgi:hypothetical protein